MDLLQDSDGQSLGLVRGRRYPHQTSCHRTPRPQGRRPGHSYHRHVTSDGNWEPRITRRPGLAMRTLNAVVPGVRRVGAQVHPYAEAWRTHNRAAVHSPARRWVVLGDSMSQGVGASAHDRGWVGQLAQRLRASGHELAIVNLSATGARSTDVLDQQLPALADLPAPAAGAPPLVTALVGSNDLFGGRAARAALPAAMARLAERLPDGSVIATLPQPVRAAALANAPLEAADAAGRLHVVDMRAAGPSSWRGRLAPDRFHPNDAGYTAIADALEPAVRAALAG